MLTEMQLLVGSSVIVGMALGAALMQVVMESEFASFREILDSARATAGGIGVFLLFTAGWALYVASASAIVFPYWALPFAWAIMFLVIVRYGLASDLVLERAEALANDLSRDTEDETVDDGDGDSDDE